ncbi:MAG: polysaccharide deacetylase family protein [Gemmatimonadetes bacterium]|nr:polysaccharide deacetylase family protein [Gemmatimonadota bacterium]
MSLTLLVTIDTEGDDEWAFHRRPTLENIPYLREFEAMVERAGAKSTYFVTQAVATDARSVEVLGEIASRGRSEIGGHCHAWNNPPIDEAREPEKQYFLNELRDDEQHAKLEVLTDALEKSFGARPRTFRAGRFGANAATMRSLARLGYEVDSSVTPGITWRRTPGWPGGEGGPDWIDAPLAPYRMDERDPRVPGNGPLWQVPVTVVRSRRLPDAAEKMLAGFGPTGLVSRVAGKALGNLVWFRPTFHTVEEMLAAARGAIARGAPVLNMMLHSSEVMPGGSPYVKTKDEARAFLGRTEKVLEIVRSEMKAVPRTLAEYGQALNASSAESSAEMVERGTPC